MNLWWNILFIFFVRVIDVTIGTISTVLIVRGRRVVGSIMGFIDIMIWFMIVKNALSIDEGGLWVAIAYSAGYALGSYAGSFFEDKLAIGDASIQVITIGIRNDLVTKIRKAGYAVSAIPCEGQSGTNQLLIIQINRKRIEAVKDIVRSVAPDSFVTISDIKQIYNGYMR